ncbi:Ig-like domain-containing protein [Aquibacillus rhizosphaerae]|uniref:Ig-like domain-containing protein n=1 Tax=Aquibacillus rhizosphaerae TaxID=3051431 RepID=A0ABT7LEW1_9BACI|nr:Ig-like domain-containing protein [Aquibacillus sp. LR5S19]MDL4843160.1 Ig-like domain-containing protein [Aquibacillus sp. LR5S19]
MVSKRLSLLLLAILLTTSSFIKPNLAFAASVGENVTEEQLVENDYILYFVNVGDPTPSTVEGTDKLGIYSSATEQMYGEDAETGNTWGLVTETTVASVNDDSNKYGTFRYYNGEQTRDKAIEYKFELPEGDYDITLGFKNPWSGRSVNIISEDENISDGDYSIGDYDTEQEITYNQIAVTDGELDLRIQGPSSANLTNYNDPLVNYIIIKKSVMLSITDLEDKVATAEAEASKTETYTASSLENLNTIIEQARALVASVNEDGVDVTTIQAEIRTAMTNLDAAIAELVEYVTYDSFRPGEPWRDTEGKIIQAHGAGIMYDEETETYYWYGEDKTNDYLPARGVRVYSSKDLYNWEDHGLALTAIESMDDFDNDPLISELYKDRNDREEIMNDIGTNRIIERPKVIYNEKNDNYVMWFHADGPTETSTANYAKAEAGYAVSDFPTGPFVYQESNRMDRAPEDAEFNGQPDQPGMARDMNLFKEKDGTAYIIYSSEENYTLYISKLNDSYTDVVGWDKDGDGERDATYKAEYGEDYIRLFPGGHREAPAMFSYDGKYYLITSGSTGWAPNRAQYSVADDIFGEWQEMRDPSVGEGASTTFDTQSTYVIPVDPENGKYIYMGDRWNEGNLSDSRYVWLPIEFGQNDQISLKWYDEWNLELLDSMFKVEVNTELPEKVSIGERPDLPSVVNVTANGEQIDSEVTWSINSGDFNLPGTVEVTGTLSDLSNKEIRTDIMVVPDNVKYFANAGGTESSNYMKWSSYMEDTRINKDVMDQQYDPENGQTWGYVGSNTSVSVHGSEDIFSTLRYLTDGDDITYNFELDNGDYSVYVGFYDPWFSSGGTRRANVLLNDELKTEGYTFTNNYDVLGYGNLEITDGLLDVTVARDSNQDPQVSWIMVAENIDDETSVPEDKKLTEGETVQVSANSTISIENTDTKIKLPIDLPEGTTLTVEKAEPGNTSDQGIELAGDVYTFDFSFPTGSESYNGDYFLTMGYDATEFNADEVAIYYYNGSTEKWERRGGNVVDDTVILAVNSFSTYGVFAELDNDGEDGQDGTDGEDGQDGTDGEDGQDGADGEDGQGGTDGEDGQDGTDGEDGQDGTDGEDGQDGADGQDGEVGNDDKNKSDNELPETATNMFNLLVFGSILLLAGAFIFIIRRKKTEINKQ